jgi:hypothetical protein
MAWQVHHVTEAAEMKKGAGSIPRLVFKSLPEGKSSAA